MNMLSRKYSLMLGVALSQFCVGISPSLAIDIDTVGWNVVNPYLIPGSCDGNSCTVTEGYKASITGSKNTIEVESGAGIIISDSITPRPQFQHIIFEEDSYFRLPAIIGANVFDVYDRKATAKLAAGEYTVSEGEYGDLVIDGYEDKYSVVETGEGEYIVYRKGYLDGTSKNYENGDNILIPTYSTFYSNGGKPTLTNVEVAAGGLYEATNKTTITNLILNNSYTYEDESGDEQTVGPSVFIVTASSATNHTIVKGDLVLGNEAIIGRRKVSSSLVTYEEIYNDDENFNLTEDITNLTLVGGVNNYFSGTGVISTTAAGEGEPEKTLTFAAADDATKEDPTVWDLSTITMSGWNNSVAAANTDVYASNINNFTVSEDARLTLGDNTSGGYGENVTAESGSEIVIKAGSELIGLNIEDGANYDITLDGDSSFDETSVIHGQTNPLSQGNDVDGFTINDGSTLRVTDGGSLTDSNVYGSAVLTGSSTAGGNTVYDGGMFSITGGSLSDITLKDGSDFSISSTTSVDEDAVWEIETGADLNNTVSGDMITSINTLILTGGLHEQIEDHLSSGGNNLVINNADEDVDGSGISGWDSITVNSIVFNDHTVQNGETLTADANSTLSNLVLENGAVLDAAGADFSDSLTVDAGATLQNGDYTNIGTNLDTLTLTGGMNTAFEGGLTANGATLNLNDGEYTLGDGVSGWQTINANSDVKQTGDISLAAGGALHIKNSKLWDFSGNSPFVGTITGDVINDGIMTAFDNLHAANPNADDKLTITGNYTAGAGAKLNLDVDAEQNKADKLVVNGTISGTTIMSVAFVSQGDSTGAIQVVENNTAASTGNFILGMIYGSPFVWEIEKQADGWYIDHERGDVPPVTPETGGYISLLGAAFEQTRDLTRNVRAKIYGAPTDRNISCYDYYGRRTTSCVRYADQVSSRVWVSPVFSHAQIDRPLEFDANITGLDAGFDFAPNNANKIGVLVSYRHGDYDFSGKGHKIRLGGKADVKIDSYLGGLYYNFDNGGLLFNSILYAGMQDAEVFGKDGVKADGNAFEGGLGLELGYRFTVANNFSITPSLSAEHTIISYEDMEDNAGKKAEYDLAYQGEFDFGVKFAQDYWLNNGHKASWYIKPSIVQTVVSGDEVKVTGLNAIESLNNETLLRLRLGGYYGWQNGLSTNAEGSYTANSKYKNLSVNLGLRYDF